MAKIFRGKETTLLYSQLKIFFERVSIAKPASSRNSSIEAFVVCERYAPPVGYVPQMINPMGDDVVIVDETDESMAVNRVVIPFLVCGDMRGFDSDMTYDLQLAGAGEYKYHEVVQKPIAPAYKDILDRMKVVSLRNRAIVTDDVAAPAAAIPRAAENQ